jgi:urea carboxylase
MVRSHAGQADRDGTDAEEAVAAMQAALDATRLAGIETNLRWLRAVVRSTPS